MFFSLSNGFVILCASHVRNGRRVELETPFAKLEHRVRVTLVLSCGSPWKRRMTLSKETRWTSRDWTSVRVSSPTRGANKLAVASRTLQARQSTRNSEESFLVHHPGG